MNKRIIVIFVCLLLVIVPTVLLSAVFVVRDIDVVGIDGEDNINVEKIAKDSGIPLSSSIFVLSEKNALHNIEVKNPDIKVVNIERIVPSKIVINVTKRLPLFAVGIKNTSRFALIDRELRVVDIVDSLANSNVAFYDGYVLDIPSDVTLTNQIISLDKNNIYVLTIAGIVTAFESKGYTKDRFPQMVESIHVDGENNLADIRLKKGSSIEIIIKSNIEIDDFVMAGLTMFEKDIEENNENYSKGTYYYDVNAKGWRHKG